jgi:hypothetical protein
MHPSLLVEDISRMRRAAARRWNRHPQDNGQGQGGTDLGNDGQTLTSNAAPMGRNSADIGTRQATEETV